MEGKFMLFKIGDKVRVKGSNTEESFKTLHAGVVAEIIDILEDEEYPIQLEGFHEGVLESEIELAEE